MVNTWKEISLPTLLSNYDLKDIYNGDKFGLFYKCMTSTTCQLKSEKYSGGKLSKVCITGVAAVNAVGDKAPTFIIGKARIPSCFKNVSFYLTDIDIKKKKKTGWIRHCLNDGCEN